jgi:predicted ATPase
LQPDERLSSAGRAGADGGAGGPERPGERALFGRGRELAQIEPMLEEASRGPGRILLVTGEPGVGKTRLGDEIAARATARGLPVLWGRSWEAGGAPAYWPWLEVLGGLARALDDAALRDALGEGASLVADLLPELRGRLVEPAATGAPSPPAPPSSTDEARFRLWRAVVSLVRRGAAPRGLLLVFDDLHSADRSSLLMLYALAREIRSTRVMLIATCRDVEARLDPETGQLITRLGREGVTLGLGRLDRQAALELLHGALGARRQGADGPIDLSPAVESAIFDRTQGNPLFLGEMVRLIDEEGPAAVAAGVVPAGVRDVIRQRLDRVSPETRQFLNLAAVAGDELSLDLLQACGGGPPEVLAARIAECVRAGVVTARAGRPRFAHALVREVLYRELSPAERSSLHRTVGRALERLPAVAAGPPWMELAHHALESGVEQRERAVELAIRAAAAPWISWLPSQRWRSSSARSPPWRSARGASRRRRRSRPPALGPCGRAC